jgi:AraC-like DNA-binding protein
LTQRKPYVRVRTIFEIVREAKMDPLSDMLSLLKVRSYMSGGFDAGGEWSLLFDRHDGIKFYAVVFGECWLSVDGVPEPLLVKSGDFFLLPRGRAYRIASDLSLPPVSSDIFIATAQNAKINLYNGGGEFFSVCGNFDLTGADTDLLLGALPPVVHIHKEADKAVLRWCVNQMMQELRDERPGNYLVIEHLVHMMLVQALRLHIADAPADGAGWLLALSDQQISTAIKSMHEEPERRWTLQTLADAAAMSRTVFTLKFKKMVGTSPLDYLTQLRMRLAAERLASSRDSIATISASLGYESVSAFSTAFKRLTGHSPREYRRGELSA